MKSKKPPADQLTAKGWKPPARFNRSADRTRSADARAGSRGNKRLRNVGPREKDYPPRTVHFYNCDGSYAGSAVVRHSPECPGGCPA